MIRLHHSRDFPLVAATVFALAMWSIAWTSATAEEAAQAAPDKFAALEEALTGATLVGQFTVTGRERTDPRPERYEIKSLKHVEGDMWLFQARVKYGDHDVTLPLMLPIQWAGDTPVITVDTMAFPGLGTYSARVMIHDDHYAGYWRGGTHGGHLFGVVERAPTPEPGAAE